LIALLVLGAVRMTIRAKGRLNRLMPGSCHCGGSRIGFNQSSRGRFLGLPWYHVRLGTRPTLRSPVIKAWIAISDGRALGGLFAFGPFAFAPVSMGIVSVGVLGVGILAVGGGALGIAAAGWWSAGAVAAAGFASKGVWVVAPEFTSHVSAFARHGGDAAAQAYFAQHWFFRFVAVSAECLVWAGLLGWVMPVILTGWQLWRTRPAMQSDQPDSCR
jgi:hypothetical protein